MTNHPTVFVVDDDPQSVRLVTSILKEAGLEFRAFTSSREFLAECSSEMAGCLVLDLRMPELDGRAVLERLAEKDVELPTLVLTGAATVSDCTRAFHLGVIDFLEKPVDPDVLLDRIQKAMGLSSAGSQSFGGDSAAGLLHATMEQMKLGVALTDGKGRLLAANPAFCDFLGYSVEELLTKDVKDITVSEDMPAEDQVIRQGQADSRQIEKRYIAKDGRILDARLTYAVTRNPEGEIEYAFGIVEDLSKPTARPVDCRPGGAVSQFTGPAHNLDGSHRRPKLTPREEDVLKLLIEGRSLKQIANLGKVSLQSVWKHQQRILKKFAVENEVELTRLILLPPTSGNSNSGESDHPLS